MCTLGQCGKSLMILLMLSGAAVGAEENTPEAVAKRAMVALKENRVDDFAGDMHPEALKSFRKLMMSVVEGAANAGKEDEVLPLFHEVSNAEQLKKLEGKEFFVRFYRGLMTLQPQLKDVMAGSEWKILGHVKEGEDLAHVVARMKAKVGEIKVESVSVISLKRTPTGWAMLLTGDIEGVAAQLKQQFGDP